MIEATQRKLAETQFFFRHLGDEQDRDVFGYYLVGRA